MGSLIEIEDKDRDEQVAEAMATAHRTSEAMSQAFGQWAKAQPDGSVVIVGAATGMAKVTGLLLGQITDPDARVAAAVGAVATLLVNASCNMSDVIDKVRDAERAYMLATAKEAGHA